MPEPLGPSCFLPLRPAGAGHLPLAGEETLFTAQGLMQPVRRRNGVANFSFSTYFRRIQTGAAGGSASKTLGWNSGLLDGRARPCDRR